MTHTLFSQGLTQQFGLTGSVQFDFLVDEKGAVTEVKVVRVVSRPAGADYERALREAIVTSVRSWRFEPALQEGSPVRFWFVGKEIKF